MTVASEIDRVDYTGNGSVTSYSYTFRILSSADLKVITTTTAGVETTLALTTDYTVSGVGVAAGGSITLVAGVLTSGYKITIKRNLTILQSTALAGQRQFFSSSVEAGLDRLAMIEQMLDEVLDRCIKFAQSDSTSLTSTLVTAANRANSFLVFDASGNVSVTPSAASLSGYTAGSILFAGSNGFPTQNNASFFWDSTNLALTINAARAFTAGSGVTASVFFGQGAGNFTFTSNSNTGFGNRVLASMTNGSQGSTAVGNMVLNKQTSGFSNTGMGNQTMQAVTTGYNNTGIGYTLVYLTTGMDNTAVGDNAMVDMVDGIYNLGLGNNALLASQHDTYTTAVGAYALVTLNGGSFNTSVGAYSFDALTTGSGNVAVGYNAGHAVSLTSVNCVFLGRNCDASVDGLTNAIAIGYFARVGASSTMALGGTASNSVGVVVNGLVVDASSGAGGITLLCVAEAAVYASSSLAGNSKRLIRAVDLGTGSGSGISIETSVNQAAARNFGFANSVNAYGDLCLLQSTAKGGNPLTAGTVRLSVGATGGIMVGTAADPGAGVFAAQTALSVGTTPATVGAIRLPNGFAMQARNQANGANITMIESLSLNSVNDIIRVGGFSAGVVGVARSGGAAPNTTDLPAGQWCVWRDTGGATTKLYYNNAGAIQSVALA